MILLNIFVGLFALDSFDNPQWYIALFMHLIPNYILTILTVIAWKHEKLGGYMFLALSLVWIAIAGIYSIIFIIPTLTIGIFLLINAYSLNSKAIWVLLKKKIRITK